MVLNLLEVSLKTAHPILIDAEVVEAVAKVKDVVVGVVNT